MDAAIGCPFCAFAHFDWLSFVHPNCTIKRVWMEPVNMIYAYVYGHARKQPSQANELHMQTPTVNIMRTNVIRIFSAFDSRCSARVLAEFWPAKKRNFDRCTWKSTSKRMAKLFGCKSANGQARLYGYAGQARARGKSDTEWCSKHLHSKCFDRTR